MEPFQSEICIDFDHSPSQLEELWERAGESSEGRVNDEALEEETAQCKILPTFSSFLHPNQLLR